MGVISICLTPYEVKMDLAAYGEMNKGSVFTEILMGDSE